MPTSVCARASKRKTAAGGEPAAVDRLQWKERVFYGTILRIPPDAGVEPRARVVAVEVVAGDPELAAGAVGDKGVEVVGGTDATAGAEPLRGGVGADLRRIRTGDVGPLRLAAGRAGDPSRLEGDGLGLPHCNDVSAVFHRPGSQRPRSDEAFRVFRAGTDLSWCIGRTRPGLKPAPHRSL